MLNNKIIELLLDLGLTEYEARTLSTLFKLHEADAPNISRNAEIPKTRVYDVLEKLKTRGLVLEVYGRPKKYKVVDPNDIFNTLLESKRKNLDILNNQVKTVLVKENWTNYIGSQEKILQVKNLKDYNKLLSQELDSAKNEINGFTFMDDRDDAFKNVFSNSDLNIKLITKPLSRKHYFPDHVTVQEKEHSMDAFVIDKDKVVMSLNDLSAPKNAYHLTVLQNNPSLAKAILNHFHEYWE